MTWKTCAEPALGGDSALCAAEIEFTPTAGNATLEFGRFRMFLHRRQLLAEGAPSSWDRALSASGAGGGRRVAGYQRRADYPCGAGIIVSEENLKVQISRLRRPLMKTATLSAPSLTAASFTPPIRWSARRNSSRRPARHRLCREPGLVSIFRPPLHRSVRNHSGGRLDAAQR
jgi:hypothetical protein